MFVLQKLKNGKYRVGKRRRSWWSGRELPPVEFVSLHWFKELGHISLAQESWMSYPRCVGSFEECSEIVGMFQVAEENGNGE
jgi:hypothetical protein